MADSNILTRKELEKMTNEQLIDFAMKLQDNLIKKVIEIERNTHRLGQYSRREYIEIAGVTNSITNELSKNTSF